MADVELLPLPEPNIGLPGQVKFAYSPDLVDKAIRANVEHAVALLQAEIEQLRAKTAVMMGVGTGDGNLFVHGNYESIKAAQAIVLHRNALQAEVEALRAELDNKRADGVHSCGDHCQRDMCVLRRRAERLAEALRWYAEQAQLCRKFGSEGDAARHALSADGGKRANRALAQEDRND